MKWPGEAQRYLERYRGDGEADTLIVRAGNALIRADVNTLAELAALSDGDIARMRGVGAKTKAFLCRAVEESRREQKPGLLHL